MSKSKTLICVVTGTSTLFSGDYLAKKIGEYGSEEALEKLYVCKEVKSLLKKKYKIIDIRKVLSVPDNVPVPSTDVIEKLEILHNESLSTENSIASTITEFTSNRSDKDVEEFIVKYIM